MPKTKHYIGSKAPKTKHLTIRKRKDFPKCLRDYKQVKGISIGQCITVNGLPHHGAHTHVDPDSKYYGWICLSLHSQLRERLTLLHELAHLLIPLSAPAHGKEWREAVVKIGGTYKSFFSYHKNYDYEDYSPRFERE